MSLCCRLSSKPCREIRAKYSMGRLMGRIVDSMNFHDFTGFSRRSYKVLSSLIFDFLVARPYKVFFFLYFCQKGLIKSYFCQFKDERCASCLEIKPLKSVTNNALFPR